jgi:hypothetical protein
MAKGRQSNKEAKKKPTMTLKEKRAAKKSKEESKTFAHTDRVRIPSG